MEEQASVQCKKLKTEVKALKQKAQKQAKTMVRLKLGQVEEPQNHGCSIPGNSSTTEKTTCQ